MRVAVVLLVVALAKCTLAAPPITALAFSPDGKHVVAASQMKLTNYHWPSLKSEGSVKLLLPQVTDISFANNSEEIVVTGGAAGEWGGLAFTRWPFDEKQDSRLLTVDGDVWFRSTAIDHGTHVVATTDGLLAAVNGDGEIVRRFQGHSRHVLCAESFGDIICSAGDDTSIRVWNRDSGELLRTLNQHTGAVRDLAVRPNAEGSPMLASAGADKTVRFWQPTTGRLVRFARVQSAPLAIDWTPDGRLLLAACEDGCLRVIDPATVKVLQTEQAIEGWAYAVAASGDGHAVIAGENGQIRSVAIGQVE